jgi:outer membrane protein
MRIRKMIDTAMHENSAADRVVVFGMFASLHAISNEISDQQALVVARKKKMRQVIHRQIYVIDQAGTGFNSILLPNFVRISPMNRILKLIPLLFIPLSVSGQTGNMVYSPSPVLQDSVLLMDSLDWPPDNSQPWTLEQCIAYAQKNNISVRQQQLNVQLARVDLRQSQGAVLPNLNGYASHTYQYGRTVDRFTNTFANSMVLSDNFYLQSSVTVFSGMQNYNSIKQSQLNVQSGQYRMQQTLNDIGIQVANAYLQVLFTQEQAELARQQVSLTKGQVDRMQKLLEAGTASQATLLQLQAQLAQEEVTRITAENNVTLSYLNLTQLMNLQNTEGFSIAKPATDVPSGEILNTTPEAIYQVALNNQPYIKQAQTDYQSADRGVAIAQGALSPSVTLQASIGTGYSGAAKQISGTPTYTGVDTIAVTTSGDAVVVPTYDYNYVTTPFTDQFNNNVNKSFGVQVNIPIFNRFQVSSNIERAKIQRENAQLNIELSQQQLHKDIQQAWADAKAAYEKYLAAQIAVNAAQASFNYTEQKFNVGALNSFDYNAAKTQLAKAQSDLISAKYDYIFRLKILDYYQGKPLTF